MPNAMPISAHRIAAYKAYQIRGTRTKNKVRRLTRHLAKFPKDKAERNAFEGLASVALARP